MNRRMTCASLVAALALAAGCSATPEAAEPVESAEPGRTRPMITPLPEEGVAAPAGYGQVCVLQAIARREVCRLFLRPTATGDDAWSEDLLEQRTLAQDEELCVLVDSEIPLWDVLAYVCPYDDYGFEGADEVVFVGFDHLVTGAIAPGDHFILALDDELNDDESESGDEECPPPE